MNYSKQRAVVLEAVQALPIHPTADEVYHLLKPGYPTLSIGTVYRNLNQLCQHGQLLKIPVAGGPDRFDGTLRPHEHLLCQCCGRVVDLPAGMVPDLQPLIQEQPGFRWTHYDLLFHGLCPQCLGTDASGYAPSGV